MAHPILSLLRIGPGANTLHHLSHVEKNPTQLFSSSSTSRVSTNGYLVTKLDDLLLQETDGRDDHSDFLWICSNRTNEFPVTTKQPLVEGCWGSIYPSFHVGRDEWLVDIEVIWRPRCGCTILLVAVLPHLTPGEMVWASKKKPSPFFNWNLYSRLFSPHKHGKYTYQCTSLGLFPRSTGWCVAPLATSLLISISGVTSTTWILSISNRHFMWRNTGPVGSQQNATETLGVLL